eukprot:CAMPEP_0119332046 /NCGR_PEP_ID=MMETSP1333-20130426/81942_1 /TAXON_ID=418940 /ORGANISM="Scyphosphaera apsteinii, Strain RCC1455" /LENGTH=99 /DNA_ID=CAMNT_0007341789 /DNA_START=308 /DNA_END=607 /DNA_ORIENTATION=-
MSPLVQAGPTQHHTDAVVGVDVAHEHALISSWHVLPSLYRQHPMSTAKKEGPAHVSKADETSSHALDVARAVVATPVVCAVQREKQPGILAKPCAELNE